MICLFVDAIWHTADTEVYGISYTWEKQLFGRKINPNWKPKE
ncbi:hypothetical protein [Clostridium cellulovorans]|nr:hypothetical protein [Clostridium cellulovorans]